MRFDLSPTMEDQKWKMPTTKNTNVAAVITESKLDVEVDVARSKDFESEIWASGLKDSQMVFAVVEEDQGA
ncbi:MAG: hypothetical protein MMC33_005599 [Icmadophila ericetorum]|nr:hypothetical protein [Icmadophila ericetorum]